jgi:2-hydroxychromene-2-carboxylate isomerase
VPYREPGDVRFDPRRLALACAAAARLGVVESVSRCLLHGLFVDGVSPLDDNACVTLAQDAGLDPVAFRRALEQPKTAAALTATVAAAVALGVFGVPSFVLGDEVFFGNDRPVAPRPAERTPGPDIGKSAAPRCGTVTLSRSGTVRFLPKSLSVKALTTL